MNVKNCRKCRRIFNYVMGPILCQGCREAEESKFQEVKKYVQENKRCGMQEVAEACDVSLKQIQQWLREERLMLADDSPMGIECEEWLLEIDKEPDEDLGIVFENGQNLPLLIIFPHFSQPIPIGESSDNTNLSSLNHC